MAWSRDYKLGYSRGYNAGSHGRWPEGVPPIPEELVFKLAMAAKLARDRLDGELATMDPDDSEWEAKFGPAIDAVDEALEAITTYALTEMNKKD